MTIEFERSIFATTLFHTAVVYRKGESLSPTTGETLQTFAPVEEDSTVISVTASKDTEKFTAAAHGLVNGDKVRFTATALPGGLAMLTDYFVVNKATDDFQVSLTLGGAAVNLSSNGSGVVATKRVAVGAIACALSMKQGSAVQTEAEKKIAQGNTFFAAHDEDLQVGDRCVVTLENGSTKRVVLDSLSIYPSHIEATASLYDEARA
jgi:hypothetical protein